MDDVVVRVMDRKGRPCFEMYYDCPMSGRRFTRSSGVKRDDHFSDRQRAKAFSEAQKAAGKWQEQLHAGTYKRPSRIDWAEFRRRYEDEHLASLKPSTAAAYSTVLNLVERILRPKRLRDLTPDRLSYFQGEMRKPDDDGWQPSENTINSYLKMLRAALGWAVEMRMLSAVPKVRMPRRAKAGKSVRKMKGRPITTEEFERIIGKVPDALFIPPRERKPGEGPSRYQPLKEETRGPVVASWRRLLNGLWLSGLRLGEALELSWDDETKLLVDFTGRRPMFRMRGELQKSNEDQPLPMTPDFAALLEATPTELRSGPVFPLYSLRGGVRCDPGVGWVSTVICRIGKLARVVVNTDARGKVKYASAHDLRRSFGDRWARRVMPAVLQQLMRHEDIQTTMRYYVDLDAETTADAVWAAAERHQETFEETAAVSRPKATQKKSRNSL